MQKNPEYDKFMHPEKSSVPMHNSELAVISNSNDLQEAKALHETLDDIDVKIGFVPSTVAAMDQYHSEEYLKGFYGDGGVQSGRDLLQELFDYFIIYVSLY